jgi:photosystem II stability/assembly factor-like uncharacterized protein
MSVRILALGIALAVLSACSNGGKSPPVTPSASEANTPPASVTVHAVQSPLPSTTTPLALAAGCARNAALADRVEASAVSFVDARHGFAIGWADDIPATQRDGHPCPIAWTTTDGGASWAALAILPASYVTGLRFTSAMDGWAYGTDALFVTHDGARTWQPVPLDGEIADFEATATNAWLLERTPCPGGTANPSARDQQRGLATPSACPLELRLSDDGGATWRAPSQPPPAMDGLPAVGREGANGLIAARADPGTASSLWATANGGETWSPLPPLAGQDGVSDIVITPSGDTYLLTVGQPAGTFQPKAVLRSTDRVTWETVADAVVPGAPAVVGNILLSGNARTLTVTPSAMFIPTLRGSLLASFDGGSTWTTLLGYNEVFPQRAVCQDANCWLPVATGIYRSSDSGHTWTLATLPGP